jgi:hypothetical protein
MDGPELTLITGGEMCATLFIRRGCGQLMQRVIGARRNQRPALLLSISECLAHRSVVGVVLPSLRRQETERATMLGSLRLHVAGMPVDWDKLYPEDGATVQLPQYPWQRAGIGTSRKATERG